MVTKDHTYLKKPVGKSTESIKSEVFLLDFLINLTILASNNYTDAFTFPEEIFKRNTSLF